MRDARQRKMKIIRIKAYLENLQIEFTGKNCKMHALIHPFHPISLSAVQVLWHWFGEFDLESTNNPTIDICIYPPHLSA